MRPTRPIASLAWLLAALTAAGLDAAQTIPPGVARKLVESRSKEPAKAPPTSRPAEPSRPPSTAAGRPAIVSTAPAPHESRYGKLHRILKFTPAKPQQIRAFHQRAHDWARQTRQTITKDLRLVETAHFLIFTTWPVREHRSLAARCEAMYRALCRQFDIPATRNIWAGKLPVFMFWQREHYAAFTTTIDKVKAVRAGGYNVQTSAGFTYVVLSHTKTKTWFYEVLIHESTHAFLGRYLTNRIIPRWANEGLAEYMAAKLVKNARAGERWLPATRLAVARNMDVSAVFSGQALSPLGYGISQSLVRYMAASNRKGLIQFIRLMKEGKSEKDALRESMNLTHAQLAENWRAWARRTALSPPTGVRRR